MEISSLRSSSSKSSTHDDILVEKGASIDLDSELEEVFEDFSESDKIT